MRMKTAMKAVALGVAALGLLSLAGCGKSQQASGEKTYKIGVVQLVEHNALDAANRGFVDGRNAAMRRGRTSRLTARMHRRISPISRTLHSVSSATRSI